MTPVLKESGRMTPAEFDPPFSINEVSSTVPTTSSTVKQNVVTDGSVIFRVNDVD